MKVTCDQCFQIPVSQRKPCLLHDKKFLSATAITEGQQTMTALYILTEDLKSKMTYKSSNKPSKVVVELLFINMA